MKFQHRQEGETVRLLCWFSTECLTFADHMMYWLCVFEEISPSVHSAAVSDTTRSDGVTTVEIEVLCKSPEAGRSRVMMAHRMSCRDLGITDPFTANPAVVLDWED